MLYLEDYLEMIEHLPQELRDRFTEMRELDLTVQNSIDSLEKKTRSFFQQCKRGELQNEACESEFQTLRKEYYKVLEDADEKVVIATQIHELVERYLRRLDSELFKFKCELEADNNGITEILEKRSLEMDGGSSAATALLNVIGVNQKENRYFGSVAATAGNSNHSILGVPSVSGSASLGNVTLPSMPTSANKESRYRPPKVEKRRDSMSNIATGVPEKRPNLGNNITTGTSLNVAVAVCPIKPGLSGTHAAVLNPAAATVASPSAAAAVAYNLQQLGGGGAASNAIAAAASQAIVATQQMQQGRRTASLKASYEAIHGAGGGPTEFWISRDIANAATVATHNTIQSSTSEKKQKKKLNTSHTLTTANAASNATIPSALSVASSSSSLSVDSVDMLPSVATINNVVGVTSLGLTNVAAVNAAGMSTTTATNNSTILNPNSSLTLNESGYVVEQTADGEWSYDPNEPRYCTCNQVSYGDMVACDNEACPYEWFHYPCVGITQPPKGKWYCPKCTASMRRRNRKN